MATLRKLLDLLAPKERKHALALLGMILVMALLDVIGVASIMPFMQALTNPLLIETNPILSTINKSLGFSDPQQFLFFLGVLVFVLLVLSLSFKALSTYAQLHFAIMREYSIGKRLIEGYLQQPYVWFLNRHSADLGKTILSEVSVVVGGSLMPLIILIAQSTVAISLLILLLLVDPILALTVSTVLGIAYGLILKLMSGFLSRIGQERIKANEARFIAITEAFGAAKEVKVGGLEQVYISRFGKPAEIYARNYASGSVIAQIPRFALEAIAFGGMLLLVLYLMANNKGFSAALPIIALYAFAGYRVMPALQQIYASLSQLRFTAPALDALHADMTGLKPPRLEDATTGKMVFRNSIQLNNIFFTYPGAIEPVLKDISLTIPAHSTIGLVGSTGSGKTTVLDLILGLLEPYDGTLIVDGQIINSQNRRQWQKIIGYVPQQIFLADDSIAANIAFGVEPAEIDQAAVEQAAKIANLHDFVVNQLPQGYATAIGERGVRLSGGQRQRIGIARALYRKPKVLILDEATSALDNLTEQAVMEAVSNLGHEITIILVAHRLSTVRQCDLIYLLNNGQVIAQGSYSELCTSSPIFQKMTNSAL